MLSRHTAGQTNLKREYGPNSKSCKHSATPNVPTQGHNPSCTGEADGGTPSQIWYPPLVACMVCQSSREIVIWRM